MSTHNLTVPVTSLLLDVSVELELLPQATKAMDASKVTLPNITFFQVFIIFVPPQNIFIIATLTAPTWRRKLDKVEAGW